MRLAAAMLVFVPLWAANPAASDIDLYAIGPRSVADCDGLVLRHPASLEAHRCYAFVATRHGLWAEAARGLEARLAADPGEARAMLYLGVIESSRRRARGEGLLREALERLEAAGEHRGALQARLELGASLEREGRRDDARRLAEEATEGARRAGETDLELDAMLLAARLDLAEGDLVAARSLCERARELARGLDPAPVQARLAAGVASMAWAEGRLEDSKSGYLEAADLYERFGDSFEQARELYNAALATGRLVHGGRAPKSEVIELARRAIEVARTAGNPRAEALARMLLAQDPDADLETRIDETARAIELLRRADSPGRACFSLRTLAGLVVERDGSAGLERALELLDEALECADSAGSTEDRIRARIVRAGLFDTGRSRDDCVRDLLDAVEGIEALRDRQPDQLVRARFLWDWAFVYYRLAGRLLEPAERSPSRGDADLAFRTIEKLRSRILLDALDGARATERVMTANPVVEASRAERGEVLLRIAAVQRELGGPGLTDAEAGALLDELRALEAREVELRVRMARDDRSIASLRMPEIPSIADLQRVLAPDQALLSFQLSTRETDASKWYWNGGSWVFVITRDGWDVVPLPDRDVLEKRIAVYLGLLARRDALEREAGARLYGDLLSAAAGRLDPAIRRWVVIPDGAMHRLPLSALRPGAEARPLAARFELSEVPSATLWYRWKTTPAAPRPAAVLALADAEIETTSAAAGSAERAASWPEGAALDRLPRARAEARRMVRGLGRGSALRKGRAASERFVKSVDLGRFGVLHLATHSVVDPREPQRSAVLLHAGAPEEDGRLQLREIVDLDLDGALVILSGCSSALGEITDGEGVVGMARAFFQAGARSVVASLWPLRDDEAETLMAGVADALAGGASVGEAVAATRRAAVAAGNPVSAWAGLVVLGDADHVPVPGGAEPGSFRGLAWAAVLLGLALSALLLFRRPG